MFHVNTKSEYDKKKQDEIQNQDISVHVNALNASFLMTHWVMEGWKLFFKTDSEVVIAL